MAERRMFSRKITESDDFLEMPDSTQNLYFHLSMNADDDGFVDKPKSLIRMIGAKEDDIKILLAKSFILPFDSGVIVIRHWRLNNYLQKDRKKDTIYKKELNQLFLDENGAYTFDSSKCLIYGEKQKKALTPAQQKRLDAKNESDLPYSFEYKIKNSFLGEKCPICGKVMNSYSKQTQPTIQHNKPISKGGKHELSNISVICGECNYSIQDNETGDLNNKLVIEKWEEIQKNENVSGMDTQDSIDKNSIDNNIYSPEKEIFDFWNSKEIIKHRELTEDIRKSIAKALNKYKLEDLKTYIDRYVKVVKDNRYFFDYKWSLKDLLDRKNGISAFTDDGSKWIDYCDKVGIPSLASQKEIKVDKNGLYEI